MDTARAGTRYAFKRHGFGSGLLLAGAAVLVLAGCGGVIQRVELDPATRRVCNPGNQACGVPQGTDISFRIWGKGKCDSVGLAMGDGVKRFCTPWDFGEQGENPCVITYKYQHIWPGAKTVHAFPAANCAGESKLPLNVMIRRGNEFAGDFWLGYGQPTPEACSDIPGINQALRKGTRVFMEANRDPAARINFGCCIHDADGEPNSVAPASFPSPGLKKFSLVLRIGGVDFQGGTQTSIVTTGRGKLQGCVNDDLLTDNTGAWGIKFTIDESQAEE